MPARVLAGRAGLSRYSLTLAVRLSFSDTDVDAITAVCSIDSDPSIQPVAVAAPGQGVVPRSTEDIVNAGSPVDDIVSVFCVDQIIAGASLQAVVACATVDDVIAGSR